MSDDEQMNDLANRLDSRFKSDPTNPVGHIAVIKILHDEMGRGLREARDGELEFREGYGEQFGFDTETNTYTKPRDQG